MSLRTVLVGMLALMSGGSAVWGIKTLRNQGPASTPVDMVPVVVAAADVPRGAMVAAPLVTTRNWPKGQVPPGAITKPEDALGRAAIGPLVKGELVIDGKLAPKGTKGGLSVLIPKGKRAFTIQATAQGAAAGFILPGNKVDVLLTLNGQGGDTTTTLLQDMEILAIDQRIDAPADNKINPTELRLVTLVVTPDQATTLALAQNKGTLQLSLRNGDDNLAANTRPATLAGLRFYQGKPWDERAKGLLEAAAKLIPATPAPVPAPAPAPRQPTRILVFRGAKPAENVAIQPLDVAASTDQ